MSQTGDILLHANVLRNFGQSSVADGAQIVVRVTRHDARRAGSRSAGDRAARGGHLTLPEEAGRPAEDVTALPLEPARVKWFDKDKGFGFANVFGRAEDVFVHVEVLRVSGFADLQAGEAVACGSSRASGGGWRCRWCHGKLRFANIRRSNWSDAVGRGWPAAPAFADCAPARWNCAWTAVCDLPSRWRTARPSGRRG